MSKPICISDLDGSALKNKSNLRLGQIWFPNSDYKIRLHFLVMAEIRVSAQIKAG